MKIQIGQTEIKFPVRFDEGYGVIFDADNVKILDVDAAYPDKKWTPRRATVLGRLIAAALNAQAEKDAEIERLKSKIGEYEEQSAVCPEDVGFVEYIQSLQKRIAQLEDVLSVYATEANWSGYQGKKADLFSYNGNGFTLAQEALK